LPNVVRNLRKQTTNMKTRFRILTILFAIGLLSGFGFLCTILDLKLFDKGIPDDKVVLILIPLLNLLLLAGLVSIMIMTKTVNFSNDLITVNYVFRLKKITYNVSELIGFNWDTLTGPADYKRITLWFDSNKKLRFSDFEIGNFYEIESYLLDKYRICTIGGRKATDKQIETSLKNSKEIDLTQIKRIKYIMYFLWALIGFIFYQAILDLLKNSGLQKHNLILISISIFALILSIMKFINENKRKKIIISSAQHRI